MLPFRTTALSVTSRGKSVTGSGAFRASFLHLGEPRSAAQAATAGSQASLKRSSSVQAAASFASFSTMT